jgi:hypothetical protein
MIKKEVDYTMCREQEFPGTLETSKITCEKLGFWHDG